MSGCCARDLVLGGVLMLRVRENGNGADEQC